MQRRSCTENENGPVIVLRRVKCYFVDQVDSEIIPLTFTSAVDPVGFPFRSGASHADWVSGSSGTQWLWLYVANRDHLYLTDVNI